MKSKHFKPPIKLTHISEMCVIDGISEGFLTSQWPNKLSNVGRVFFLSNEKRIIHI